MTPPAISRARLGLAVRRQLEDYSAKGGLDDLLAAGPQGGTFLVAIRGNRADYYQFADGRYSGENFKRLLATHRFLRQFLSCFRVEDTVLLLSTADCLQNRELPLFGYSKHLGQHGLMFPDICMLFENHYAFAKQEIGRRRELHPWDTKAGRAIFRGSTTGGRYEQGNWQDLPRTRLVRYSLDNPDVMDARFSQIGQVWGKEFGEWLRQSEYYAEPRSFYDCMDCRYMICVDGNAFSHSRFAYTLLSNCIALHVKSIYDYWCRDFIDPGTHFLEIAPNLSDLRATIERLNADPGAAARIIDAANSIAQVLYTPYFSFRYLTALLDGYRDRFALEVPDHQYLVDERDFTAVDLVASAADLQADSLVAGALGEEEGGDAVYMTDVPVFTGGWEMKEDGGSYLLINRTEPTRLGFRCNASAAAVLAQLDGETPLVEVVETVAQKTGAPAWAVFDDMRALVADLVANDVVSLRKLTRGPSGVRR